MDISEENNVPEDILCDARNITLKVKLYWLNVIILEVNKIFYQLIKKELFTTMNKPNVYVTKNNDL